VHASLVESVEAAAQLLCGKFKQAVQQQSTSITQAYSAAKHLPLQQHKQVDYVR
jgi:hypothetical protein